MPTINYIHLGHPPVLAPPSSGIDDGVATLNRTSNILGVTLWHPLHIRPSRPRLCQAGFEGSQQHESPSLSNLGFATETLVATYKVIGRPILNYAAKIESNFRLSEASKHL